MSREEEPVEFKVIEAALAALVPATGGLDRDRLMYLAGRASVLVAGEQRKFRWAWPLATATMTTVAAALLVVVSLRLADPAPRIVERIVERKVEVPVQQGPAKVQVENVRASDDQESSLGPDNPNGPDRPVTVSYPWSIAANLVRWPTVDLASHDGYTTLRNQVLRDGPGAWPEPSRHAPADAVSAPATYRQMLDSFLNDAGGSKSEPTRPAGKAIISSGVRS